MISIKTIGFPYYFYNNNGNSDLTLAKLGTFTVCLVNVLEHMYVLTMFRKLQTNLFLVNFKNSVNFR